MNSQGGLLVPITWTLKGPSTHPERDQDKALVIEGLKAVGKKHSRSTGTDRGRGGKVYLAIPSHHKH